MKKVAAVLLLAAVAGVLYTLIFGETRVYLSMENSDFAFDRDAPSHIDFLVEPEFDEMTGLHLGLPPHLRRTPVRLELVGEEARFIDEEPGSRSSQRSYRLEPPGLFPEKRPVILRLTVEGGAAPPEGEPLENYYKDIVVIVRYNHDLDQTLTNFGRFKPVASPMWVASILFCVYLAGAVLLIGSLRRSTRDDQPNQ